MSGKKLDLEGFKKWYIDNSINGEDFVWDENDEECPVPYIVDGTFLILPAQSDGHYGYRPALMTVNTQDNLYTVINSFGGCGTFEDVEEAYVFMVEV